MKQQVSYNLKTNDIIVLYKSQWERLRTKYYQDFFVLDILPDKNKKWYKPWTWFRKIVVLKYAG